MAAGSGRRRPTQRASRPAPPVSRQTKARARAHRCQRFNEHAGTRHQLHHELFGQQSLAGFKAVRKRLSLRARTSARYEEGSGRSGTHHNDKLGQRLVVGLVAAQLLQFLVEQTQLRASLEAMQRATTRTCSMAQVSDCLSQSTRKSMLGDSTAAACA